MGRSVPPSSSKLPPNLTRNCRILQCQQYLAFHSSLLITKYSAYNLFSSKFKVFSKNLSILNFEQKMKYLEIVCPVNFSNFVENCHVLSKTPFQIVEWFCKFWYKKKKKIQKMKQNSVFMNDFVFSCFPGEYTIFKMGSFADFYESSRQSYIYERMIYSELVCNCRNCYSLKYIFDEWDSRESWASQVSHWRLSSHTRGIININKKYVIFFRHMLLERQTLTSFDFIHDFFSIYRLHFSTQLKFFFFVLFFSYRNKNKNSIHEFFEPQIFVAANLYQLSESKNIFHLHWRVF